MSSVNVNVMGSEMVSLNVPSSVLNMLTNIARDVVQSCAARHGFDAEEEMRYLGLDVGLVVELKKGKSVSVKKESSLEEGVVVVSGVEKSFRGNFPLPYNGGQVVTCCSGLKENHGLMTQCQNGRKGDDKLCKTCDNQASKNSNGLPTYGTIEMRNACGIFEYVAPCGKSPVAYSKVMKKLNLSMEQLVEEAAKRNMVMDEGHFVEVDSKRGRPSKATTTDKATTDKATTDKATSDDEKKVSAKGKGRPKKAEKAVELKEPTEDLFATLLATSKDSDKKISKKKAVVAEEEVKIEVVAVEEVKVKETKVKKAVAKIESKKAEPVVEVKEVVVEVKVPIVEVKEPIVESKEVEEESDDEDDEESDSVTRMEYKGVKYLKSSNTGVIYNMDEDVVGKWNEKTKEIDFHDVEEEEEEYDEE